MKLSLLEDFVSNIIVTMVISNKSYWIRPFYEPFRFLPRWKSKPQLFATTSNLVSNSLTSYIATVKTIQHQLLLVYDQLNKAMTQTTFWTIRCKVLYEAVSDQGPVWVRSGEKIPSGFKSTPNIILSMPRSSLVTQLSEKGWHVYSQN